MTQLWKGVASLGIALCTTLALGCGGDPTGPTGSLSDPAGLSADLQALGTPFGAAPVQSFHTITLTTSGTPASRIASYLSALSPGGAIPSLRSGTAAGRQSLALAALRPALVGPSFNSVIPPAALGKSYIYDPNAGHYVEGTGSAGPAPSNGIRFALYAIDPLTQRPATPLVEVGHADLLDESTSTTSRLHVLVKGTGSTPFTYADYTIVATSGTSSFSAQASGYVTNGTARLDFTTSASATQTQVVIDHAFTLDQPSVSAHLQETLTLTGTSSAALTLNFSVTRGNETVVLAGTLTLTQNSDNSFTTTANFTVTANGGRFATISGTIQGQTGTFTTTGPGGRQLTAAEQDAVQRMFSAPTDLTDAASRVFLPIEQLLGTGEML